jgi:hypothetical protein
MSKEVSLMKTHVVIKYRAPGSGPDQDDEIKTEAMPYEPEMAFSLIHAEGQTFSLWSDYPDKYGDQPKDYIVVERYIEPGIKNKLNVIVTDPDSEQMPTEHPWWEPTESPEPPTEATDRGDVPPEPQEPSQRRSWLHRFFFGP